MTMQFIYELKKFGINVSLQGGKLRLDPKERITPGVVEYVKKHKAEIIRELKARSGDREALNKSQTRKTRGIIDPELFKIPEEQRTPEQKAERDRQLYALAEEMDRERQIQRVESMTLEQLKQEDLAIRVYSRVLDEEFYICSNEAMKRAVEGEGLVCYLPDELERLRGLGPEDIKRVHTVKREFNGTITNRRM